MIYDEAKEFITNESAQHEKAIEFFDRRIRQLSEQYREWTGRPSFRVRIPSGEGFDYWYFSDGKVFRNGFSALDHQYVLMHLAGMRER
jgi:hypothetical protein